MNRLKHSVFWILLTLASLPSLHAQDSDWPRTVAMGQGMVTIYSPQIDEMRDNTLQYQAAIAYRASPGAEPVFGAGWFESPVNIDQGKRIVQPTAFNLTNTRFPAGTDDIQSELAIALAQQSPDWNLDFSLDELEIALKTTESEIKAVNTTPPKIVYRDHPALLISIDGEPILREVENSSYKAVINTPYPLISDGRHFYLNAAKDVWYRARNATGPYQFEPKPPTAIAGMVSPDDEAVAQEEPSEPITAANAPEIVVSTEPTELIVTDGPAAFVPLVDDLLVLQNSDDDVFMHISSQEFYIVLAGRWYRADSLTGPWAYQASTDLPNAFADIPRDSNQAESRVYVAGTEEARDAVLDAQVPQTAAVQRGEVDIEVKYDGEPVYQPVDGTDLVYIQNTGSTVLLSGGLYYLVEEGVWYVSASANGPWQVSDHRPEQVDTILPTSPVYNTKYVHVYESTPSVVYVGYTPGYMGSYVYRNTIFYGTGWYYRPWVSPYYYYPRFSTWGFNVSYNYWTGWNFGLSWGWGPFNVSYYSGGYWHRNHYWYGGHHGRWGPGRYRHRPSHHGRGHHKYARNDYRRGGRDRYDGRRGDRRYDNNRGRDGNSRSRDGDRNLYRDRSQRAAVVSTRDRQSPSQDRYVANNGRRNYSSNNSRRSQNYVGKSKNERNRTGPVSTSDIRSKARARDAKVDTKRTRMLTENNSKVYSRADRKQSRSSKLGGVGTRTKNTQVASVQPVKGQQQSKRGKWQTSPSDQGAANRSQKKWTSGNQREPASRNSKSRQTRTVVTGNNTRQRSIAQTKSPGKSTQPKQPGNSRKSQPRVVAQAPARKTRQASQRTGTVRKSSQRASAPVQRQARPAKSSAPRSAKVSAPRTGGPRSGGPGKSAPVHKVSRNNSSKSGSKRGGSKSNRGGNRRK